MNKYIRTAGGIYEVIEECFRPKENNMVFVPQEGLTKILNQSNTIEELCDEFVVVIENKPHLIPREWLKQEIIVDVLYGAIWTDKGLIYVAKMNEKGELELL